MSWLPCWKKHIHCHYCSYYINQYVKANNHWSIWKLLEKIVLKRLREALKFFKHLFLNSQSHVLSINILSYGIINSHNCWIWKSLLEGRPYFPVGTVISENVSCFFSRKRFWLWCYTVIYSFSTYFSYMKEPSLRVH